MDAKSRSTRLKQALSDAAPAAWDYDLETLELFLSDSARELYGFQQNQKVTLQNLADVVAPEDRDRVFKSNLDFVTGQNIRYRISHPDKGLRWIKARTSAHNSAERSETVVAYTGTIEDVTDEMVASHALLESEERLRFAVEAGKMAIWEIDLETGAVTNTPQLNAMFGFPRDYKPSLAELRSRYAPGELEKVGRLGASWEAVKKLVSSGQLMPRPLGEAAREEDRTQVSAELSIVVPPNTVKHLLYRAQYVYSLQGRPKITGFLVDITEKRHAEEQLGIIAHELRHRVKNSFAVVQVLATQIFRPGVNPEAALQSYLGRLQALSIANDIVLDTEGGVADFKDIAERITAPYRDARVDARMDPITLSGPSIQIKGRVVTAFSMVLHELCTNALKYGALSRPGGQVLLSWKQSQIGRMTLEWLERGGPEVTRPERQGFGTKLLNLMVSDTLSGSIDLQYHPSGLTCRISSGTLTTP